MEFNFCLAADSYKPSHSRLYPDGLQNLYAYLEARGGRFPATVFFGLQYYLERYLVDQVFDMDDVHEAALIWGEHFGRGDVFDVSAWTRLYERHGGALPLRIRAVPEGSVIPTGNVLMTVESTDPEFAWLVGWVETLLLKLWYPITVATQSFFIFHRTAKHFRKTGSPFSALDFAVHDFGYRGVSSEETAALGGAAHLTTFSGSDTMAGIRLLREYYYAEMPGYSVPATEHSVILAFGGRGYEGQAFRKVLDEFPEGIVACVSDTFDIYHAVENLWGGTLKGQVTERDGKLVIRPDSGDPLKVVPSILYRLGHIFGVTENDAGYKVLPPYVGVIQGDGMDYDTIDALYATITSQGWAASNLVVGSGGGLLQKLDRDTCKFAYKVSQATVSGEVLDVRKIPATDSGKRSKAGRLKLRRHHTGIWETISNVDTQNFEQKHDYLRDVFVDGVIQSRTTHGEIYRRLRQDVSQQIIVNI